MTTRAFLCRVKPHNVVIIEQALSERRIYSGLHRVPNLLDPDHTIESIQKAIYTEHRGEKNYPAKVEADMFWIFSRSMKIGDLILVPARLEGRSVFFLAKVSGNAYHDPAHFESRTTYRRSVHWLNRKVPVGKERLSAELYSYVHEPHRVRKSFLDISDFANEIKLLVDPSTDVNEAIEAKDDIISADEFMHQFEADVAKAMADSSEERMRRIKAASRVPNVRPVLRYEYVRNPDVVAEALFRANGVCGKCGKNAPFNRKSGLPYLEVHHIVQLAKKGEDVLENTIALCPNCHREAHYGSTPQPA